MKTRSILADLRLNFQPKNPKILQELSRLHLCKTAEGTKKVEDELQRLFSHIHSQPIIKFAAGEKRSHLPIIVGVVLSGGQAAGGHNVIAGIFDALKKMNPESRLYGFLNGPGGIVEGKYIEIEAALLAKYRNQGGFDIIGSGRTKIETPQQFQDAAATVKKLGLDGLIVIGGDDSNTNAALLAEYFMSHNIKTAVIGVPKTIDGDLKNDFIEIPFGFDTACKTYAEIIGNVARDSISQRKYYFFIKIMGRSASHIALECALQTHPNLTLIAEELEAEKLTIQDVTNRIADVICMRSDKEKNYGVILIPEGVIEFIPECRILIAELNALLAPEKPHIAKLDSFPDHEAKARYIEEFLGEEATTCFQALPQEIRTQLLLDRDPHGNVQVSKIETERLFIETVKQELKKRQKEGRYKGKFSAQPLFVGYEGRSALPTNFDAQYCYALGQTAALLIDSKATGYMAVIQDLTHPVEEWQPGGIPLVSMMQLEMRHGKPKPVIKKALVDLAQEPFVLFKKSRDHWIVEDSYIYPGPIQFFGPTELTDNITLTLKGGNY